MPRRDSPRSPSRTDSPRRPSGHTARPPGRFRGRAVWLGILTLMGGLGGVLILASFGPQNPSLLRNRADAAARAGDWPTAADLWHQVNTTDRASSTSYLGEGRACLAIGRAGQAEQALRKAAMAEPTDPDAWLLLLEVFRVEDRWIDALLLGWPALERVALEAQPQVLRELTLAALTDLPDELARTTLKRWIEADPDDLNARAALLRRMGSEPRADDPDREARIATLASMLASHPRHVGVRDALVSALADAGEPEAGRTLLESWPPDQRDGRYWRLRGLWDLEHDQRPQAAVTALRAALADFPHDWRIHYRLARALRALGRSEEAHHEAETVGRIRELLDPLALGPVLDEAFKHLDSSGAGTLAQLCARVGLTRLADRWRSLGSVESRQREVQERNTGRL